MRIQLRRRGPGYYVVTRGPLLYVIQRVIGYGWRWRMAMDAGRGGEWRTTKREAVLDLTAHLGNIE